MIHIALAIESHKGVAPRKYCILTLMYGLKRLPDLYIITSITFNLKFQFKPKNLKDLRISHACYLG